MFKGTYHSEDDVQLIEACVTKNLPVLLMGETGTGKTTLVREMARSGEKKFIRLNLNGQTTREDIVGKYTLIEGNTIWQDGLLLTGIRQGYWILLDEINAALPEVLLVLQALLEVQNGRLGNLTLSEKDGEVVVPHEDARIFGTCNPSDYIGMKDFNQATLSRFVVLNINHMDRESESELLQKKHNLEQDLSRKIALLAEKLRSLKKNSTIQLFLSTRDLEQVAMLVSSSIPLEVALNVCVLQKTPNEGERNIIREQISNALNIDAEKLNKAFVSRKELQAAVGKYAKLKKEMSKLEEEFKSATTKYDEIPF